MWEVCKKGTAREQILRELGRVGLQGSERQPVSSLSCGMRRRTALVRALIAEYMGSEVILLNYIDKNEVCK